MFGMFKKEDNLLNNSEKELQLKKREADLLVKEYEASQQAKGYKQRNEYECTWHSEREMKRVELVKLEAEISLRREETTKWKEYYERIIRDKDIVIASLTKALEVVCSGKEK